MVYDPVNGARDFHILDCNPACETIENIKKDKFIMEHIIYEGKVVRQKYEVSFKQDKAIVNGQTMDILENTFGTKDQKPKMVVSHRGRDGNDNQKCTFRYTLSYENDLLKITKEVKFDNEQDYFVRNQYQLQASHK